MNFVPLLNASLKSDEVLELLDSWDCDVVYDFDRTQENIPDQYWVKAEEQGVQMRFDGKQLLKTVFLYVVESDGISAIDLSTTDIPSFSSLSDIRTHAKAHGINTSEGQEDFLGELRDWIRLELDTHHIHYEFRSGLLSLATLSAA